ncbi:MAG TPA: hypothetical protein VGI98_00590, partial [Candidatus Limnocylindrales bacterium]
MEPTRPAPGRAVPEIARAIARAEGLQATAAALASALRVDEVAEVAVREGLARLGAGRGVVALLQPDGRTIRPVSQIGFASGVMDAFPTFDIGDHLPIAEAMRGAEPVLIHSAADLAVRYPDLPINAGAGGPA